uniref:Uncharacterized protein n=1 Tax=Oryza rufipogon TaxID=4529 RepID=A0A0E0QCQ0_ORYRU
MDADAPVLEALLITFTVATVGFVFIIGTFAVRRFISPLNLSVLAAFWAWGLIAVKRFYFWGQRNGRDQMFFLILQIHVYEISSFAMLLLLMLFNMRPNDLEALSRSVVSVKLFLAGLCITGYGMGLFFTGGPQEMYLFFRGDLGVYLIAFGMVVLYYGHRCRRPQPAAAAQGHNAAGLPGPLIVYILVILAATYVAGDLK